MRFQPQIYIRQRWNSTGGYREILTLAVPLILSTSAWSIQHFVDRLFLTWHSPEAIAASMPSGLLNFTIMCLFLGTVSYINTFVAQYHGAKQPQHIGPSIWQGIYISIIGAATLLVLRSFAEEIFTLIGHGGLVYAYEVVYFKVLTLGTFPALATAAFSSFFSGRGQTWPLVWINMSATAVNIVLDYALIFGHWGLPAMGVRGAALATVLSAWSAFTLYLLLIYRKKYRDKYKILSGWRFDPALFTRILRYGLPNGIQFFLDIAGFTTFLMIMGRLGTTSMAATNIAFNINNLAFMPMLGIGIAVSVKVGNYLGDNNPDLAARSAYSGFHITFLFMATFAVLYVFAPGIFIRAFGAKSNPQEFETLREIIRILLRFVAVYSLFDALNLIFSNAIKGAGDTRFVMVMIFGLSLFLFVIPSYIALAVLKTNLYVGWVIATIYISSLGIGFYLRFRGGKWRAMRVIECPAPCLPSVYLDTPTPD